MSNKCFVSIIKMERLPELTNPVKLSMMDIRSVHKVREEQKNRRDTLS
jgi:hypothetical protein